MKINKQNLLYALQVALRVVPRNANIPILNCVLIDGPGQRVIGTNLDMAAIVPIEILDYTRIEDAVVETPPKNYLEGLLKAQLVGLADDFGIEVPEKGKVQEISDAIWAAMNAAVEAESGPREVAESYCLDARSLQEIVKTLEEDDVEIKPSGEKADLFTHLVSIGENFRNLSVMDVDDFPAIPEVEAGSEAMIEKDHLKAILPAVLTEDGRDTLHGAYFDADNRRACATDGHRLHMVPAATRKSFILPVEAAGVMIATVKKDETRLHLSVSADGEHVVMDTGKAKIITRTSEGNFPDVDMVIPKKQEYRITIKKSDVVKAFNQAMLMQSDKYAGARLTFNGGIDVEVTNPEKGEYQKTNIPMVSGRVEPSIEMGFNLGYVQDVMKTLGNDDEIEVGLTDEKSPLTFAHGEFQAIVMPART